MIHILAALFALDLLGGKKESEKVFHASSRPFTYSNDRGQQSGMYSIKLKSFIELW